MKEFTESSVAMSASLRKNFVFLATSNLLAPFFSMALVLAISRLRGVEELGKYSLVMTIFVLGQSCVGFGLPLVITREVAQTHEAAGKYLASACIVSLLLLIPILAVAFPILRWAVTDQELYWAICLVLMALLSTSVNAYGEAVLLAFEHAGDFVTINMVETMLRAIVGMAFILAGYGVAAVAGVLLFFRIIAAGVYVVVLRKRGVRLDLRPDRALCRNLLGHIPIVGLIPVVNAIYARADIFLLTWLASWTDVGLYSAAMRFVDLARTFPPAYARALYPILARLRAGPDREFQTAVHRAVRTVLLMTSPVAIILFGVGGSVLTFLYGPGLAGAVPSLRLLAWTIMPHAIAITLAQVLFSACHQAVDLRVNVIACVASVAANLLLIPRLGATGAATSTLFATCVYSALQYLWTRQYVTDPQALGDIARIVCATLGSCVAMALIVQHSVWLATAIGLLCYGTALVLFGFVQREDWARFRLRPASTAGRTR